MNLSELKIGDVFNFDNEKKMYHYAGYSKGLYHFYHNVTNQLYTSQDMKINLLSSSGAR